MVDCSYKYGHFWGSLPLKVLVTFAIHWAMIIGWLRSTVCGTPVFGRRTDPVLRSAYSRRVTTMWVNRPLQVSQLGQLSLSSFRC